GITDTAQRNQLSTEIFEALQILKSAYQNGHIDALIDALNGSDSETGLEAKGLYVHSMNPMCPNENLCSNFSSVHSSEANSLFYFIPIKSLVHSLQVSEP
ncbi:hypothetical protein BYT27DRAFT_7089518, partial [Phlegmacium glaucopus]